LLNIRDRMKFDSFFFFARNTYLGIK